MRASTTYSIGGSITINAGSCRARRGGAIKLPPLAYRRSTDSHTSRCPRKTDELTNHWHDGCFGGVRLNIQAQLTVAELLLVSGGD